MFYSGSWQPWRRTDDKKMPAALVKELSLGNVLSASPPEARSRYPRTKKAKKGRPKRETFDEARSGALAN